MAPNTIRRWLRKEIKRARAWDRRETVRQARRFAAGHFGETSYFSIRVAQSNQVASRIKRARETAARLLQAASGVPRRKPVVRSVPLAAPGAKESGGSASFAWSYRGTAYFDGVLVRGLPEMPRLDTPESGGGPTAGPAVPAGPMEQRAFIIKGPCKITYGGQTFTTTDVKITY